MGTVALDGIYPVSLAIAMLALSPFIVVSSGYAMYLEHVMADLHASRLDMEVIASMATAGYAFGALIGGDFGQRFHQRHTFLIAEAMFVLGCILSAASAGVVMYGAGRDLQGLATGVLLVAAVPPVIQNYPPGKVPITVIFINIAFFGAVCAGPLLGGAVWLGHDWRWFYEALAMLGAIAFFLALFALPVKPPPNPRLPFDYLAVLLSLATTVLVFLGSASLTKYSFSSYRFIVPTGIGLLCFVVLMLMQYHQKEPLSPIKQMWTTLPVIGTLVAMVGGGIFFSFLELVQQYHMRAEHQTPWHTGLLMWPLVPGVLIAAALFGGLVRTRLLPFLILFGLACIVGGGAMIATMTPNNQAGLTLAATGLLGLGAGASVAPGLFLAGFSLGPQQLGRIFALIELVRSVFDYVLAPVIIRIAVTASHAPRPAMPGIQLASWIAICLTIAFIFFATTVYWLGGAGLPRPDIAGWLGENRPAVRSPRLLARLRSPDV